MSLQHAFVLGKEKKGGRKGGNKEGRKAGGKEERKMPL